MAAKLKHVLSNIDDERRQADCSYCGQRVALQLDRTGVRFYCVANGKRARTPAKKESDRLGAHGLTRGAARDLIANAGKCAICGARDKKLVVDHCHETSRIRGVLCNDCNLGLGKLGDSIESLERALRYLKD